MCKFIILFWLIIISSCSNSNDNKFNRIKSNYNSSNWSQTQNSINEDLQNNEQSDYNINPNQKIEYTDTYYDQPIITNHYLGHYKIGKPYKIDGIKYYPKEYQKFSEEGVASWYGPKFHGKKTANGEIYNMNDMTASHRTLPMPVIAKVTNLENNKSVILRINDRGPFVKDRIIDLSRAAAQELDFLNQGTARVKVELLQEETKKLLEELGL